MGAQTHVRHPARALRIADPADATRYRFGTGTADFHVCRACGAVPAVTCALEGRTYAVVNVNCLEGVDPTRLDRVPTDFEGEAVADRLARRRARWIADVAIDETFTSAPEGVAPVDPRIDYEFPTAAQGWVTRELAMPAAVGSLLLAGSVVAYISRRGRS